MSAVWKCKDEKTTFQVEEAAGTAEQYSVHIYNSKWLLLRIKIYKPNHPTICFCMASNQGGGAGYIFKSLGKKPQRLKKNLQHVKIVYISNFRVHS